jgi:hypothetical protein
LSKSKVTIIKRSDIVNKSTWYLTNITITNITEIK